MDTKRILVTGSPGSGKTHFSQVLAERLHLPLHSLDDLYWTFNGKTYWTPEGQKLTADHCHHQLEEIIAQGSWIIENMCFPVKVAMASDMIIFLDVSRLGAAWRVTKRFVTHRRTSHTRFFQRFWTGINTLCFSFLYKPKIVRLLRGLKGSKQIVRIRTLDEAERLLTAPDLGLELQKLAMKAV